MQTINYIDIGVGLNSRNSAAKTIDDVSNEMNTKVINEILKNQGKFQFLLTSQLF